MNFEGHIMNQNEGEAIIQVIVYPSTFTKPSRYIHASWKIIPNISFFIEKSIKVINSLKS